MSDGPKAKAKGGTGQQKKIKIVPQIVVPQVHPSSIEEDSMGTRTFGTFKPKFQGSFSEKEKKLSLWVFGTFSVEDNRRKTYHVAFTESGASSATIFVFTAIKNTNTTTIDVQKVGAPTATLPDATAAAAIKTRLDARNIEVAGIWNSKERRVALAALNDCTDTELDKMKGLKVERASSPPAGSTDASTIGAHYDQDAHTIEVFDTAFEISIGGTGTPNGTLMAFGNDPAGVLPGASHAVLHEAAHALAFAERRAAQLKEDETFDALKKESKNMNDHWSVFYSDTIKDDATGREFTFKVTGQPTTEPKKTNFKNDLAALEGAQKNWGDAGKALDAIKQSQVMKDFAADAKNEMPVTPYSLDEKAAAKDKNSKKAALEEFFAEGFSVFHWDPEWLETHRKPVHDFFSGDKHL